MNWRKFTVSSELQNHKNMASHKCLVKGNFNCIMQAHSLLGLKQKMFVSYYMLEENRVGREFISFYHFFLSSMLHKM